MLCWCVVIYFEVLVNFVAVVFVSPFVVVIV